MSKLLTGVRAVQFTSKTFVGQTPLKQLVQTVLIFLRERPNKIFLKVTSSPEMAARKNPSDTFPSRWEFCSQEVPHGDEQTPSITSVLSF